VTAGSFENIHATALVCGDTGILLRGPSGSGKSALALRLIDRAGRDGQFAALVSDDRTLVAARGGRLVAAAPASIRGLAELHGYGIIRVPCIAAAVIDIVAELGEAARMPDPAMATIAGIACRLVRLPAGDLVAALPVLAAALQQKPVGDASF